MPTAIRSSTLLLSALGCLPRSCDGLTATGAHLLFRRRRTSIAASLPHLRSHLSMCSSDASATLSSSSASAAKNGSEEEPTPFATAFELPVDHGMCVAVTLPLYPCKDDDDYCPTLPLYELHDQECHALESMLPVRQMQFAGGRAAMRRALTALGVDASEPVLRSSSGAPHIMPDGVMGSISHTRGLATAIACRPPSDGAATPSAVGVDVESSSRELSLRIAKRVLHEAERQTLGTSPSPAVPTPAADLLLRCSLKEALYKALHPLVRRTIKWHTVQVQPQPDGTCELVLDALEEDVGFGIGATARWHLKDGFYVTTAAASLRRVPEREGEREGMPQQQLAA
jgi:4'-phosphopantetheinyl transferase EntD